jgi:hypothetical protein
VQRIKIRHQSPTHGWLLLRLSVEDHSVQIDASDVPNNPIQDLIEAVEQAATGTESIVWWHLEPHGYFMHFTPVGHEIEFRLEYAPRSDKSRSQAVLSVQSGRTEILLPFWRFLRDFQSRAYSEPHWPEVNFERLTAIKAAIASDNEPPT